MGKDLKVVQVGVGPVGQNIVRHMLTCGGLRVVGAVDVDPAKVGQDLGIVCGIDRIGVRVEPAVAAAVTRRGADVAVVTTASSLGAVAPQIGEAAAVGLCVVSTCEELAFPHDTQPALARRIDRVCRKHGVACLGTGVNPGFLMDYLPCVLSSVCRRVDRIRVTRIQDAATRRIPFQDKIGAGLTRSEFAKRKRAGVLRHVGLTESMQMIARALGWQLERTTESLKAVPATCTIDTGHRRIEKGMMCGVEQTGRGYMAGREVLRLHFRAAVGEPESFERVEIKGDPDVNSTIAGGVQGDVATCAIVMNALRPIMRMPPGLWTMLDLPVPAGGG